MPFLYTGRFVAELKANYLTSAPMVVAFALAGRVDVDFSRDPLGFSGDKAAYLRDIWPSREEIQAVETQFVIPAMFQVNIHTVEGDKRR